MCEHCWHTLTSTTNGLATDGQDSEVCCHCGTKRRHFWRMERDPRHGLHSPVVIRVYQD